MLPDGRPVIVTGATVYLLQADTSAWTSAPVQYSVEWSLSGQLSATTATLADTDLSVFVTSTTGSRLSMHPRLLVRRC